MTKATYLKRRIEAESRSEEYYTVWKTTQSCPGCDGDKMSIRLLSPTQINNRRWKFNCKDCGTHWYGPDWIK